MSKKVETEKKTKNRFLKKKTYYWVLAVILLIIGVFGCIFFDDIVKIITKISAADLKQDEIKEFMQSFGLRGAFAIGSLSALQVVLTFLPAEPVQVIAGMGYGFLLGSAICLAGIFVGNTIIYFLSRTVGDRLTQYFTKNIHITSESKSRKAIDTAVFILYFLPAIPYGMICFFAASSGMKYNRYIVLTVLCSIPSICIGTSLGVLALGANIIISVLVFILLIVLLIIVYRYKDALLNKLNSYIEKSNLPYSTRLKVRTPSLFAYIFIWCPVRLFLSLKVKLKLNRKVKVDRPCVLFCNHASFFDFFYAGIAVKKRNTNFIAARYYFYNKKVAKILAGVGAFPKSMFTNDLECAMNCLTSIKLGNALVVFPEARLTSVGKFQSVQLSTMKLIKKLNVPVYRLKINGSYLAKPKWSDGLRGGSLVEADLDLLFEKDEIEELSLEQLLEKTEAALSYNDFDWLETKPNLHYKSKTLCEGLENVLYKCPKCGKEFTLTTEKRTIKCECGFSATLNDRYIFEGAPIERIDKWYEYQGQVLSKEIEEDAQYKLKDKVLLKLPSKDGKTMFEKAGTGECILDRDGLTYKGTIYGEETEKFFPICDIFRILYGAGVDFEIYEGTTLYYFEPTDLRRCVKWYIASKIFNRIYEEGNVAAKD